MKILVVTSFNNGKIAPFICEQVYALQAKGVICDYYKVVGKGPFGYLRNIRSLRKKIAEFKPDIVHAHYGLCGLLSCMQRKVPVVVTYHGSDINNARIRHISSLSIKLASHNIFVSRKIMDLVSHDKEATVLPCGINLADFPQIDKSAARKEIGMQDDEHIVLFAGAFDNPVKNPDLAKKAISQVEGCRLIELKGYSRNEVATLMNACDALLMTSRSEGSPQVIKEAMACGLPIVSVDVGDVAEIIKGVEGCFIVQNNENAIVEGINKALSYSNRTSGRKQIELYFSNEKVIESLLSIYINININTYVHTKSCGNI